MLERSGEIMFALRFRVRNKLDIAAVAAVVTGWPRSRPTPASLHASSCHYCLRIPVRLADTAETIALIGLLTERRNKPLKDLASQSHASLRRASGHYTSTPPINTHTLTHCKGACWCLDELT